MIRSTGSGLTCNILWWTTLNCSRIQIAVLQLASEENLFLVVNKVKPHKQVKNRRKAYRLEQSRGEFLRWYWYGSIGRPLAWWWFNSSLGLNPYPLPPPPSPPLLKHAGVQPFVVVSGLQVTVSLKYGSPSSFITDSNAGTILDQKPS